MNINKVSKAAFLISCCFPQMASAQTGTASSSDDSGELQDIVVTATRNSQALSKVPVSVSAFDQEKMDALGLKTIADVASVTPGVTFDKANGFIAIRGITTVTGAGTTGIYVDDTPIQVYAVGSLPSNTVPALFDLDRVEVLRGPQGTLFGSGSMGGTVRYITPQPSLTESSIYGRAELSWIDGGESSYEAGVAAGLPIVEDRLGLRVSGYYRRDGGWIDRVDRNTGAVVDANANWSRNYALRAALNWSPTDTLTITPAVLYQNRFNNVSQGYASNGPDISWEAFSDPKKGRYGNGTRIPTPGHDNSVLYSLNMQYEFGSFTAISNTSYYVRNNKNITDGSTFDAALFGLLTSTGPAVPGVADYDSNGYIINRQRGFTQEIRLQSDPSQPFRIVVGGFYQRSRQFNQELFRSPSLPLLVQNVFGASMLDVFGQELLPPDIGIDLRLRSRDTQLAAFGEANYDILDKLTLTAGVRVSKSKFNFESYNDGPYNGGLRIGGGKSNETPITPKFGLAYKPDGRNMFYATVAKGFRSGGATLPVPLAQCANELAALGLATPPDTYKSDSVWSYEIGSKNRFFGNRLALDASVYTVSWKDIQQYVDLPTCGFRFATNLGTARSRGFDLQAQAKVTDWLTLSATTGYNDAKFTSTIPLSAGSNLVTKGDRLELAPWTAALTADAELRDVQYEPYIHAEYRYASAYAAPIVTQTATNTSFDPDTYRRPATNIVNLRIGVRPGPVDISIFANNLFNSRTILNRDHDQIGSPLYFHQNQLPRVIGITLTYRD